MRVTYENWLGLINSCIYYDGHIHEMYQVQPYSIDCKAPREHWNPLSKTVLSKHNLIWNQGPVKILNYRKAQR